MIKEKRYKLVYLLVLLLMFTLGMNFLLPNYGGSGWQMPQNVMVSMFVAVLISISTLKIIDKGRMAFLWNAICIISVDIMYYSSKADSL
jgi:hypothetical protein